MNKNNQKVLLVRLRGNARWTSIHLAEWKCDPRHSDNLDHSSHLRLTLAHVIHQTVLVDFTPDVTQGRGASKERMARQISMGAVYRDPAQLRSKWDTLDLISSILFT